MTFMPNKNFNFNEVLSGRCRVKKIHSDKKEVVHSPARVSFCFVFDSAV